MLSCSVEDSLLEIICAIRKTGELVGQGHDIFLGVVEVRIHVVIRHLLRLGIEYNGELVTRLVVVGED